MGHQVTINGETEFPVTTPARAGAIVQTADGSIVQAARAGKGGLAWALLFAGALLSSVRAAENNTGVLVGALTSGNNVFTKTGNGSLDTEVIGGLNNWSIGDRLLISNNALPLAVGVWEVVSVGAAGAPWVLSRALDARTASALPVGRTFTVLEGGMEGATYTHATPSPMFAIPGADPLVFKSSTDFGVSAEQFHGEQRAAYAIGGLYTIHLLVAAGAGGARDVEVFGAGAANMAPRSGRLVEVIANVSTLIALSSAQVRTAAAGAGDAVSGPVSMAAVGRARDDAGGGLIAFPEVTAGDPLFLRMTDGDAAGRFDLIFAAM